MMQNWQPSPPAIAAPAQAIEPQGMLPGALKAALAAANRLFSFTYMFLRAVTAAGAVLAGVVQTFVFARVFAPEQFSIFALLGGLGTALALLDFGVVKILFIRMRNAFLSGRIDDGIARQSTAVIALYATLVVAAVLVCAVIFATLPHATPWSTVQFTLFFIFAAVNFVWFALRNICVAVDEFIFFESLEAIRRTGNMALTVALLFGLPVLAFLLAINALWAGVLTATIARLVRRGAMRLQIKGIVHNLRSFYHGNRHALIGSGVYATTEIYIFSFPYIVVSTIFGLGAPMIILDTTLKIFRGASLLYGAACDLFVPRQTRAFIKRDASTLIRATWLAAILCFIPAGVLSGVLIVYSEKIFRVLLGSAAVMPPEVAHILVVLLIANFTQMVSHSLLIHAGFFKEVAKLGIAISAAMTATIIFAAWVGIDIVGFLKIYTGIYACGALVSVALVLRGPIRTVTV